MNRDRFYFDKGALPERFCLEDDEHHHLARVLRVEEGSEVEVVNGQGLLAVARVVKVGKRETTLEIRSLHIEERPQHSIQLGLPFMRHSKLDWVIEKGTELGADGFFFYGAERSQQEGVWERHLERMRHLMVAAMKQSRRLFLPTLQVADSLEALVKKDAVIFFGDVDANAPRLPLQTPERVLFVTGPESGFSKDEIEVLSRRGTGVSLGPYVLRAETAPLAAIAILMNGQGDK